ncbi:MAG: leucine-rich repeat protein, partial [Paludibacteraceae bacterium]|nr:leucine-rich repeat protein [Paludibacteraceae bacterium]
VTILNSAQTIGNNAFDNVTTMSQLILGENLTSIGAYAFRNTLQSQAGHYWIKVAGAAPKSAAANAFDGVVTKKLFVPAGVYASYNGKSPWTQFNIETIVDFPVNGTNPSWELTWDGTLTILGSVPNYTNESDQPWFPYKNYIKKVVFGSNVTAVGNNALSYANENESKITEVVVPASVTEIGENAFKNNDQIEEVKAEGVKNIGSQAFENCSSLEKVKFGKEVSSMGEKVFNNCGLMDAMAVKAATPPAITARTFEGLGRMSANAPAKVKAKYAARRATSATGQKSVSLEVPDEHISKYLAAQYWNLFTFEYIGEHGGIVESDQAYDGLYVLYSDGTMIISASAPTDPQNINTGFTISSNAKSKVKRVEIQGLLTKLGHQFNDCPNLEEVVLSGGINSLNGTFNNCPKLKTINLENVQYLKSHQQGNKVIPCFGGCVALQEVNIPNALEIGDNCFKGCTGLTTVALGGEAEVGMEAFSGCTALKRIALGNAKLNGALQAFQGCTALEEMTYSGSRMPAEIFKGCTALHKINLGGSLKDILSEAFANTSIDSIYVQCPTPPEAAANAFSGITLSSIKVIVPDAFDGPYSSAPVWEEMFTYEDEDYAELDFPIHFAIGNNGFGTVDESGNLTINAMGALVDNFRDYVEPYAPYIIGEIRIGNEVSSLPAGTPYRLPFGWVKEDGPRAIILGSGLLELGDYALYNNVWDCDLIVDCYALNPPVMKGANVFNWSRIQNGSQCVATLNVVNDAAVEAAYRADTYWKKFSISSGLTPADAPAECTVTFVDWDGTILQQTTTRPGMMVTPPADPVREGYTFRGWDSQDYTWVVSDLTITATYYDETFTVRFYDWDGTLLSEQQVHYGQAAEAPADPAREGYTFLGWSEDFSAVTLDKYIVAMYHNDHEGIEDIQPDQVPNIKVMIDGVIYILRDGKIYNILGTEVR